MIHIIFCFLFVCPPEVIFRSIVVVEACPVTTDCIVSTLVNVRTTTTTTKWPNGLLIMQGETGKTWVLGREFDSQPLHDTRQKS